MNPIEIKIQDPIDFSIASCNQHPSNVIYSNDSNTLANIVDKNAVYILDHLSDFNEDSEGLKKLNIFKSQSMQGEDLSYQEENVNNQEKDLSYQEEEVNYQEKEVNYQEKEVNYQEKEVISNVNSKLNMKENDNTGTIVIIKSEVNITDNKINKIEKIIEVVKINIEKVYTIIKSLELNFKYIQHENDFIIKKCAGFLSEENISKVHQFRKSISQLIFSHKIAEETFEKEFSNGFFDKIIDGKRVPLNEQEKNTLKEYCLKLVGNDNKADLIIQRLEKHKSKLQKHKETLEKHEVSLKKLIEHKESLIEKLKKAEELTKNNGLKESEKYISRNKQLINTGFLNLNYDIKKEIEKSDETKKTFCFREISATERKEKLAKMQEVEKKNLEFYRISLKRKDIRIQWKSYKMLIIVIKRENRDTLEKSAHVTAIHQKRNLY